MRRGRRGAAAARAVVLALAGAAGAAAPAAAQLQRVVGVARTRFVAAASGAREQLSGMVASGLARARLGLVTVEVGYAQGRLSADTGTATDRDLVDGSIFLAARPVPWLLVGGGPHARAYAAAAGGTERWLHWEARVRADGAIVPGMLQAYAEGAFALSSTVNVAAGPGGARRAEVGLALHPPQSPVWARLAYAVDRAALKNDLRAETVEMVVLSVGYGAR